MEQNEVPHPFASWRNGGILMLELNIASNIYRMPKAETLVTFQANIAHSDVRS